MSSITAEGVIKCEIDNGVLREINARYFGAIP